MANAPDPMNPNAMQRSEVMLSFALLGMLVIFLMPLPPFVLDVLLAFNISITILLLIVTLGVKQPLDLPVFPSLLLLLTLFRLALNVATTRLILLHGDAGHVVSAFGNFVVGGSLVVGLVIFLILIVIQFVVITRGASRVSEVSARFKLDAMPMKLMAVDGEMNAGLIDQAEARKRRTNINRESEFYSTMDGAGKFVRGDAIAAVVITGINLVGGIVLGMIDGLTVMAAIRKYSILTIGDGLVTQIPALIISTAAGILVTKSTSQTSLGKELGAQFANNAHSLRLSALIVFGMAWVPGLPKFPFVLFAVALYYMSRQFGKQQAQGPGTGDPESGPVPDPNASMPPNQAASTPAPESYATEFLQNDRITLEIGTKLVRSVESRRGIGLLDRISGLRRDLARQSGLWMPAVRVRDNSQLDAEGYRILLSGREVARGIIRLDSWLALNPSGVRTTIQGEETREPAFGLPALWISETEVSRAEMIGYTVVDPPTVLITHLGEVVRRHAHELLSREDLKSLIEKVREVSPAVVDDLIPQPLPMGTLHRILTLLLEERVPISNLNRILESLGNHVPLVGGKEILELTDRVRMDIGRAICDRFRDDQGRVRGIMLEPRLELQMSSNIRNKQPLLDHHRLEQLLIRVGSEMRKHQAMGSGIPLLCDGSLRRTLRQVIGRTLDDLSIIAYQEIPSGLFPEAASFIRMDELGSPVDIKAQEIR